MRGLLKPSFSRTPNATAILTKAFSSDSFVPVGKAIDGVLELELGEEAEDLTLFILLSCRLYDPVALRTLVLDNRSLMLPARQTIYKVAVIPPEWRVCRRDPFLVVDHLNMPSIKHV
jgi:hypothetical protein